MRDLFVESLNRIEELHAEELIINEFFKSKDNLKALNESACLYKKWKLLVDESNIESIQKLAVEASSLMLKKSTTSIEESAHTEVQTYNRLISDEEAEFSDKFYEAKSSFEIDPKDEATDLNENFEEKTIKEDTLPDEKPIEIKEPVVLEETLVEEVTELSTSVITQTLVKKEIIESKSIMEINDSHTLVQVDTIGEPSEFIKCLEKLSLSMQTVEKHLENIQKSNKEFYEFEKQELKLNAIKQTMESLAMALKTSMLHKNAILQKSDKEMSARISNFVVELSRQHENCIERFKEKSAAYNKNLEKWNEFMKNFAAINKWLDLTLAKFEALKLEKNLDNAKIKEIIKVSPLLLLMWVGYLRSCIKFKKMKFETRF